MSKTTINQNVTTLKAKTSLFFSFMLLFCTIVSFAQLKVKSNTIFTVKNVVSSKEEANVFDSSVLGESELVLNGQNQYLETAENSSLPTLRVADGNELTIRTELKLRKNLVVQSGVLKFDKPIYIKGEVVLENDAILYNDHFVNYENRFVFHKNYTNPTTSEVAAVSSAWIVGANNDLIMPLVILKEKNTSINESNISQYKASPFSPPPEVTLFT